MAPFLRAAVYVCLLIGLLLPPSASAQGGLPLYDDCQPQTHISYILPQTRLTGAFYYPWYKDGPQCPGGDHYWCDCFWQPKGGPNGNPRPAAGFYGSDNAAVVGGHLDQMAAHGIDVVGLEWAGFHDEGGLNASEWDADFRSAFRPQIASRPLTWVLLYDMGIRFGPESLNFTLSNGAPNTVLRDKIVADFTRFATAAEPYFHDPKYLKLGGRPYVYLYITYAFHGSNAHIADAFGRARQAVIARGFPGMYLVADHFDYLGRMNTSVLGAIGAQAVSAFVRSRWSKACPTLHPLLPPSANGRTSSTRSSTDRP